LTYPRKVYSCYKKVIYYFIDVIHTHSIFYHEKLSTFSVINILIKTVDNLNKTPN